jgi:hypothetical protein
VLDGVGPVRRLVEHFVRVSRECIDVAKGMEQAELVSRDERLHDADASAEQRPPARRGLERDDPELFVLRRKEHDIGELVVPRDLSPIVERAEEYDGGVQIESTDTCRERVAFSVVDVADHDHPHLTAVRSESGHHLEAIECALRRHDFADVQQYFLVPGDRMARAQVVDVVVLIEQRRIHTEGNDGARRHVKPVGAKQSTLVLGLGNKVIGIADDAAAHDTVERTTLPVRGIQCVDRSRDVRHAVRFGQRVPEHRPEKVITHRMHDLDGAEFRRCGHPQERGHEVVRRMAAEDGLESSHQQIRCDVLTSGGIRRALGCKHQHVVFAIDKVFREPSGVGAQAPDGGPELMAEDGDPHAVASEIGRSRML